MHLSLHSGTVIRGTHEAVISEVGRAAQAGLRGYWAPMLNGMDTLTVLALAGVAVPGIELGTAVVPIPLRTPYALAQQTMTVQAATDGRLSIGLGTSHPAFSRDFFGVTPGPPIETMSTYVRDLLPLLDGERPQALSRPGPRPPILLGAVNPRMAALAAELADGVVTWTAGLRTVEDVVLRASTARRAAGPFRVVVAMPLGITDDADATRSLVHARLGANDAMPSYQKVLAREGATGVADLALVGTEQEVATQLRRFADLGVTEFAAHVVATGPDVDRTWKFLEREAKTS